MLSGCHSKKPRAAKVRRFHDRSPLWLCSCSLLVASIGLASGVDPTTNVILVTVDTLRADRLGAYGYQAAATAHIDALAREGILFENAIVQTPFTLPSHASIFSSTYPMFHGLQDVVGRMRDDVPVVAEWFRERGYTTAAFIGASVLTSRFGLDRGFDVYEDRFSIQGLPQFEVSRVERSANRVVDLAVKWLGQAEARPFFLWLHLYDPHDPYGPPEPYSANFKNQPYDGEIAFTDAMLGSFFETLKQQDLYENSLIVFTSDHGESLGEHEEAHHAYYIYEASLRVPLIIRVPKGLAGQSLRPGTRIPNQVRSIDIVPTIVQLLGQPVPDWAQGVSLAEMMAGKGGEADLPAYAETHYPRIHFRWSPLFSYSDGRHKYIEAPVPELYDLQRDPNELVNLYPSEEVLASQLRQQLHALQLQFAGSGEAGTSGSEVELDPETIERLKALGYVAFSAGASPFGSGLNLPDPKLKIATFNQLNRAATLSKEGKRSEAVRVLKEVAAKETELPSVHFLLGMEYFNAQLYLLAVDQFKETIKRNPDADVARFNMVRSYSRAGLAERSEEVARELLEMEPRHFGARYELALLLSRRQRFEEAIVEILKALEVRSQFSEAHNNLGSFYQNLGKVDEAIAAYQQAIANAPDNVVARQNLVLSHLHKKSYDSALREAQMVLRLNPKSSLAYYYAGKAYLAKGMNEKARKAFRQAKSLDPRLTIPVF